MRTVGVVSGGCFALAMLLAVNVRAEDKDHPLVKSYPGSQMMGGFPAIVDFDEVAVVLGKVKGNDDAEKLQKVQGRIYQARYVNPKGRSVLEVYKNYEDALLGAGFEKLYACQDKDCGKAGGFSRGRLGFKDPGYVRRFLAAKLPRPSGDVYVEVLVQSQAPTMIGDTGLLIVETKPMQSGLVTVDAAALARDIGATGHVAVYGIYFDSGKSEVKPESNATLQEIAKLLAADPKFNLSVVGHTDAVGDLASNLALSKARAKAVVDALTGKHGVAAARLTADGVGPLAPVATNRTEEDRAKNRRVELIDLATQ